MEKRRIRSLDVSVAGLGCNNFGWRIDAQSSAAVVDAALETGVNFFDTADIYGNGQSEEFLGRALGGRRNEAIIATKFGMKLGDFTGGAKPEYVRQSVDGSLRRLRTDHIDLYQLHQPDPSTPIADTLGTLDDLVKAGKVCEIGGSNFSVEQLVEAQQAVRPGEARLVSVQNHYSLFHREPENGVLEQCERFGIALLPYFPLANGLLTGKYRRGQPFPEGSRAQAGFGPKLFTEENLAKVEGLLQFAESRGHSLLELATSWLLSREVVASVIAGAKTPDQVRANAKSVNWKLTEADLAEIDSIIGRPAE